MDEREGASKAGKSEWPLCALAGILLHAAGMWAFLLSPEGILYLLAVAALAVAVFVVGAFLSVSGLLGALDGVIKIFRRGG